MLCPSVCPPSEEAIRHIVAFGLPVVEIGAGQGLWAAALRRADLPVKAFDIAPRGLGVEAGDHIQAAKNIGALLVVWPPDGRAVQFWIGAARWPAVFICCNPMRVEVGGALEGYELTASFQMPAGTKDGSIFSAFSRGAYPPTPALTLPP